MDIAMEISKSLAKRSVVAKVDEEIWDMTRPIERDCKIEFFSFDTNEGKEVKLLKLIYQYLNNIILRN